MLYIVCALYCEANIFIEKLNLKKDIYYKNYQVFKRENFVVIITGCGIISAAASISSYFSLNPPKENDILINVGVCGCSIKTGKIGDIFLCGKITDITTNKSYYPDILYVNSFEEKEIITFPTICKDLKDGVLADMESSGIYQSAILFFDTHQIIFVKIVSDNLNNIPVKQPEIKLLIKKNYDKIMQLAENASNCVLEIKKFDLTNDELNMYNLICGILKFTVSMKYKFKNLLYYYKLKGNNILTLLLEIENKIKDTEIKSKTEGKKYLEYISKKII